MFRPAGLTVKAAAINGFVVLLLEMLVFLGFYYGSDLSQGNAGDGHDTSNTERSLQWAAGVLVFLAINVARHTATTTRILGFSPKLLPQTRTSHSAC